MSKAFSLLLLVLSSTAFFSGTASIIQHGHNQNPEMVLTGPANKDGRGTRIRGLRETRNADFILGGLFPVHSRGYCEQFNRINIVEAMLFAVDAINSDPHLLPNITLGYDIRDTCFIEQIGLEEAAEMIITQSCSVANSQLSTNGAQANRTEPPVIGLVGAASSSVSIPVAGLGRLFSAPQISFASTSDILSDRDRYTYFYRTIPSDSLEVQALVDLIVQFGWTYISTISSRNSYGRFGIDELHARAAERGICIDLNEGIEETATTMDYRDLAVRLSQSSANVVVFYATRRFVQPLFEQLQNVTDRHFIWIASSGWTQRANDFPSNIISGFFGILPTTSHSSQFQHYYSNLTSDNNPRNPWFREFFDKFNCSSTICPEAGLTASSTDFFVPLIIDAVYTHAHALQNYLEEICESPVMWNSDTNSCNGQNQTFERSNLLRHLNASNFTSVTGNRVSFNAQGRVFQLERL